MTREGAIPSERPVIVERSIPTDPRVRGSDSLFLTEAGEQRLNARRLMLEVGKAPATPEIADRMRVRPGEPLLMRRRLMLVDDVPVRTATSYFPVALAEGTPLAQEDFIDGGLQRFLQDLGLQFGRALETLTARLPSGQEAERLRISSGLPVVVIIRTSYDSKDRPVHTLETICAADKHVFPVRQVDVDQTF